MPRLNILGSLAVVTLGLLLFSSVARGVSSSPPQDSELDRAWREMGDAYPFHRLLNGGLDFVLGGAAGSDHAIRIFFSNRPSAEMLVSGVGLTSAILMGVSAFPQIFGDSGPERHASHYTQFPADHSVQYGGRETKSSYGRKTLVHLADDARTSRLLRAANTLVGAGSYVVLYAMDREYYAGAPYLASALGVVMIYEAFFSSPEERAANHLSVRPSAMIYPFLDGPALGLRASFEF